VANGGVVTGDIGGAAVFGAEVHFSIGADTASITVGGAMGGGEFSGLTVGPGVERTNGSNWGFRFGAIFAGALAIPGTIGPAASASVNAGTNGAVASAGAGAGQGALAAGYFGTNFTIGTPSLYKSLCQ
jgi:hypothetical protein